MRFCALLVATLLELTSPTGAQTNQGTPQKLDEIYADESHCLTGPEIRSDKDNPISCYCRDAIVDARYVWHTYLLSGKDSNLNGTELTLEINAERLCGDQYDVHSAVVGDSWKWNGPEVVRTLPPDSALMQMKPDSHGFIHYEYGVLLLNRDSNGKTVRSEQYTAKDEVPLSVLQRHSSQRN